MKPVQQRSTTQPSPQVDHKGPATVTSGKITFEAARAVGQELNNWFSIELTLDRRQASNNLRHAILKAILDGGQSVEGHDVSGELSTMLAKHGLTFEGLESGPVRPNIPGEEPAVTLPFSHEVSYVMDVWVNDAKDAQEMIERSGARCQIVNAFLAGSTDIKIAYGGPIPNLERFNINVNPAEKIEQAIENLRADLSTKGSRWKFSQDCHALFEQIDQGGGSDSWKLDLKLNLRAKIREQTTVPLKDWFLAEVSALKLTKGSEGVYIQEVNASLAAAALKIDSSSISLPEKLKTFGTLLGHAKHIAQSPEDREFRACFLIAVSGTCKEEVFPVVMATLEKAGINEDSRKREQLQLDEFDASLIDLARSAITTI